MSQAENRLLRALREHAIKYEFHEHEPVFTVKDSAELHYAIAGAPTKNLFLKDGTGRYWVVTLAADDRADLKRLAPLIGSKKLSFGSSDDLLTLLGLMPGSVTPLGVLIDTECRVTVVLDKRLMTAERVNVHPLRNTATIGLKPDELHRLLSEWRHSPQVLAVPVVGATAPD